MSETATPLIPVMLNGKAQEIPSDFSVSDLLSKWKIRPELVTVEVNENILQKLDYDGTKIQAHDRIEFVFYMGGGGQLDPSLALGRHLRINSRGRLDPGALLRKAAVEVSRALIYMGGGA